MMEEERGLGDEDDSDDFSDDVMQPTKRQRSGAASTAASRRSFSRQLDELLLGASSSSSSRPSYRLSVMPALQQQSRFASARFIPTQATLPPSFEEEEERTVRTFLASIHSSSWSSHCLYYFFLLACLLTCLIAGWDWDPACPHKDGSHDGRLAPSHGRWSRPSLPNQARDALSM